MANRTIHNIQPFLLQHLARALSAEALELRFVSGLQPAIKVAGSLQALGDAPVRSDVVRALHEACLAQAQASGLRPVSAPSSYRAEFPGLGLFRCEFSARGHAMTLSLFHEPDESMVAEAVPRNRPPSSGTAEEPEASGINRPGTPSFRPHPAVQS